MYGCDIADITTHMYIYQVQAQASFLTYTVFTRIVAQGYYYFFTQKQGLNHPNSAALRHYLRVRYYKILHSCTYYNIIKYYLSIDD